MKKFVSFLILVGTTFVASSAFAEAGTEAAAVGGGNMWLAVAAGFGMALASVGGAWSQSKAICTALDGIARNPGAQGKIFVPMIVGLALIESLVLLSFVVANTIAGKL